MHAGYPQIASAAPAKAVPLMRIAGLTPFMAFLGRECAPVELLLTRAKIPPDVFGWPESLIPVSQVVRLMEDAASVRGLPRRLTGRMAFITGWCPDPEARRCACGGGTGHDDAAFNLTSLGNVESAARSSGRATEKTRIERSREP